jgi:hypothetical protein
MPAAVPSATPRVSVVLAVYNGEEFLRETIASVLAQTFRDFEFVVVNDGSTDASRDVVLSFGDPRIRLLDNPRNLGLTPSLNRGIGEARGEFIARIDADDVAAVSRLARQVRHLDRHPEVALVGSWYREIDGAGRRRSRGQFPLDHTELRWSLMFYCPFTHSAMMWRRVPVTDAVGLYDPAFTYAMDWEYWARIASRLRVGNVGAVLTRYRIGPHSMSSNHARVLEEIELARIAAIRSVFDADASPWIAQGPVLFPVVDGWPEPAGASQVRASVDAARRMHAAFTARLELHGAALDMQQRWIRSWLARRLMTSGRKAHLAGRTEHGRLLFAEARRLDPRSVMTINCGRYFVARALDAGRRATRRHGQQRDG